MARKIEDSDCPLRAGSDATQSQAGNPSQCPLSMWCEAGTYRSEGKCTLAAGQTLFEAGEAYRGIYVVTTGAFKKVTRMKGGNEQVVDFRFPGDLLGLSALGTGLYPFTTFALQPSTLCRIDVKGSGAPTLNEGLLTTMSRQLHRVQWNSVLLRIQNAEQRVIRFLLDTANYIVPGGDDSNEMKLPMSRKDIANYLGVAVETVSRSLHRLQEDGLLVTSGRRMALLDRDALRLRLGKAGNVLRH